MENFFLPLVSFLGLNSSFNFDIGGRNLYMTLSKINHVSNSSRAMTSSPRITILY